MTSPRALSGLCLTFLLLTASGCGSGGDCRTGAPGCPCYPNLTCDGDGAGGWLVCSAGRCQSPVCTVGAENCSCYPNRTCNAGLACQEEPGSLRCVPGTCEPGTLGCPCQTGGACAAGLACSGGLCLDGSGPATPPAEPRCYTPCRDNLVLGNGTVVACSAEGLLEGCLGDALCVRGSCVTVSQKDGLPTCTTDVDCPDFQTCIQGGCYSTCELDTDCDADRVCHRHVCRPTCTVDEDSCTAGTHCSSTAGSSGVCMPLDDPEGTVPDATGSFSLSADQVSFTNARTDGSITLVNDSDTAQEFTLRKLRHSFTDEIGYHSVTENALSWLSIGAWGHAVQAPAVTVLVEGGGTEQRLVLVGASNPALPRWQGVIEISNPQLGTRRVQLTYSEVPDGQWQGKAYYFAQFGDQGLDEWVLGKDAGLDASQYQELLSRVGNAFLQKWGVFRRGWISFQELMAALNATTSGSWAWPSTRSLCPWPDGACFLYDNPLGYVEYTDDHDVVPVPTGVAELPIAFNLRVDPEAGDARVFSGRVVTHDSLHYLGDPALGVTFELDPTDPTACSVMASGACVVHLQNLRLDAYVGGRFRRSGGDSCPAGGDYAATRTPWLVPGFEATTGVEDGQRYAYECRTQTAPLTAAPGDTTDLAELNRNLAGANPIPDGRGLSRSLELVDGALVDAETLVVIFRERFGSFLDPGDAEGFTAFGVMILRRNPTTLEDADYVGQAIPALPQVEGGLAAVGCSAGLVDEILGGEALGPDTADAMAEGVIQGTRLSPEPAQPIPTGGAEVVHYYCEDTGRIDGGAQDDGTTGAIRTACPWGSRVQYFTLIAQDSDGNPIAGCQQADLAALGCQQDGSCQSTLNDWVDNDHCGIRPDPVWRCSGEDEVYCEDDRLDLRSGKTFYQESAGEPVFVPLGAAIDNAFRYKVRFRSRTGASVGFAPAICVGGSDAVPYCYDPEQIEQLRERLDCALHLFHEYYEHPDGGLGTTSRQLLRDTLAASFSRDGANDRDGFERLDAELLVMMGDESFTRAFASRFDLAGQYEHAFEGSRFEPQGIDLGGGAGFEMYTLHQATQYYQLALDRFYTLAPYLWESVKHGATDTGRNFVSQETVVHYLDRVARASTQRIRAVSEIARRYQGFNRPDLARRVVERAFSSAYLESVVLARMTLKVVEVSSPATRAQIRERLQRNQRAYDAALSGMRDVYTSVSEDVNLFGYPPDYIPFPALDPADTNAFERSLEVAQQRLATATAKEEIALASSRAFDTDAASFQAELVQIRQTYENQLADLCGSFVASDGLIYPAIPKYAYLHPDAEVLGNPCGLVGNGAIHGLAGDLKLARIDLEIAISRFDAHLDAMEIERQRLEGYCDAVVDFADMMLGRAEAREDLYTRRNRWNVVRNAANLAMEYAGQKVTALDCITIVGTAVGTNCPQKGIAFGIWWAVRLATAGTIVAANVAITDLEKQMRQHEDENTRLRTLQECEYAKINGEAKIQTLALDGEALTLEMAKAHYAVLQRMAEIEKAHHDAQRQIAQQAETEEMTIDVEAARNDPNVRIYQNDAVLTADRTFTAALQAAYKATLVYEYYTSQTFAHKGELYLIRMVAHGDYPLENYLYQLEEAFYAFEESYGNPDTRVLVLSLRDDILDIPRLDERYRPLTEAERVERFRRQLVDPAHLDGNGYFTAPFNTTVRQVSPLTRNHKVLYVEAEIVGSDAGDREGRVYLRQRGSGIVRAVGGDLQYRAFPERTAVINTFFNGERRWVYSSEDVLRTYHLRDRPLLNTRWELVLNRVDELVNQDVNLLSLSDIRLYVYYTDFTAL